MSAKKSKKNPFWNAVCLATPVDVKPVIEDPFFLGQTLVEFEVVGVTKRGRINNTSQNESGDCFALVNGDDGEMYAGPARYFRKVE